MKTGIPYFERMKPRRRDLYRPACLSVCLRDDRCAASIPQRVADL